MPMPPFDGARTDAPSQRPGFIDERTGHRRESRLQIQSQLAHGISMTSMTAEQSCIGMYVERHVAHGRGACDGSQLLMCNVSTSAVARQPAVKSFF